MNVQFSLKKKKRRRQWQQGWPLQCTAEFWPKTVQCHNWSKNIVHCTNDQINNDDNDDNNNTNPANRTFIRRPCIFSRVRIVALIPRWLYFIFYFLFIFFYLFKNIFNYMCPLCHLSLSTCHLSHVTCHLSPDHHSMELQLLHNCMATANRTVVVFVKEFQWDQRPHHGAVQGSGQGLFLPHRFLHLHQSPGDDLTWPLSPTNHFWSGESTAAPTARTTWPGLAPPSSERSLWPPRLIHNHKYITTNT